MKTLLLLMMLVVSASPAQVPRYTITMDPADRETLFTRDAFSNKFLPAAFESGGTTWKDVKVRFKGRSNRFFAKKSYRLKFPNKHPFNGVRTFNLHAMYSDKSFLREKLSWDFFADLGALAPRASYAALTLNGRPQGLYLEVDRIDADFLARRGRAEGSLYNAGGFYSLADLTVQSTDLLKLYYPKEAGDEDDYRDLDSLLHAINDTPDASFADRMDRVFDMNSVYDWLAGNIVLAMGDSYNKNYYLYRDPSRSSGKWTVIPWDYDQTFGLSGDLAIPYPASLLNDGFEYRFPPLVGPANALKDRLWKDPRLRARLVQRVDSILRSAFTEERMFPRIDSLAALIGGAVRADTAAPGSYRDFLDNIGTMKHFVTARRNFLLKTFTGLPAARPGPVTLSPTRTGVPYNFIGSDGEYLAALRFSRAEGLDSVRVEVFPGVLPPHIEPSASARAVRRWLRVTPFPAGAAFTATLQWCYHDASSTDREVGKGVNDERGLRCFSYGARGWVPLPTSVNPFANLATVDSVTEKQCGERGYFGLFIP